MSEVSMCEFLTRIGCSRRHEIFVLDGFSSNFFFIFDARNDPESPEYNGTACVLVAEPGVRPSETNNQVELITHATQEQIRNLIIALGVGERLLALGSAS